MPNMVFTASRSAGDDISVPISIPFTVSGTATFASDYTVTGATTFTTTNGSMIIPAGQASAAMTISTVPDATFEPDETIILTPTAQAGSWIVGASAWIGTILNDDGSNVDPLFANVVLLMPMTTTSGITDVKGKIATNQGASISTTIVNPFGQNVGVLSFPGSGAQISIAQSSDFAFGSGAMAIDGWLYPTSVPTTGDFGFMDTRAAPNTAAAWAISGNTSNQIAMYDTSTGFYEYKSPGLVLNQWNYICFARPTTTGVTTSLWINGVLVGSNATRNNAIAADGSLKIGNTIDAISSSHTTFTGYMSNIRITRAYRDGSIVPTAAFPTT